MKIDTWWFPDEWIKTNKNMVWFIDELKPIRPTILQKCGSEGDEKVKGSMLIECGKLYMWLFNLNHLFSI